MANCLWTFETNTTTGFEGDTDTISGLAITPFGDGSGSDAVPIPTVEGRTGNGRLLCSANHYNAFTTAKSATILHTSGNTLVLDFWWRPLLDYAGGLAGTNMLTARYLGFVSGGSVGNAAIELFVLSEATVGLYTFRFSLLGFYVPVTTVDFTGIPLTLRDWNQIVISYDGANAITLTVNGNLEGAISPTTFAMPTTTSGQVVFDKQGTAAIFGVLDTVSLEVT
jgi:hypothetical protein